LTQDNFGIVQLELPMQGLGRWTMHECLNEIKQASSAPGFSNEEKAWTNITQCLKRFLHAVESDYNRSIKDINRTPEELAELNKYYRYIGIDPSKANFKMSEEEQEHLEGVVGRMKRFLERHQDIPEQFESITPEFYNAQHHSLAK